jgi:hypothetical protein
MVHAIFRDKIKVKYSGLLGRDVVLLVASSPLLQRL